MNYVKKITRRNFLKFTLGGATTLAFTPIHLPKAYAKDTIKVGYQGILSGRAAEFGKTGLESLTIWKDEINAKGGLLGKEITAFILIELGGTQDIYLEVHKALLSRIKELELEEIHYVAGQEDILMKMRTKTIDTLRVNLVKITQIEGVARTRTIISLALFERIFPSTSKEFLNALEIIGTER